MVEATEHSPPVWLRQLFTRASIQELHAHTQTAGIYFLILPQFVPSVYAVIHHRKYIVLTQQVMSLRLAMIRLLIYTHMSYNQWNMHEEALEID